MKAVNSEFEDDFNDDGERLYEIFKLDVKKDHPYS